MFAVFLLAVYFVVLFGHVGPALLVLNDKFRSRAGGKVRFGLTDVWTPDAATRGWVLTGDEWWPREKHAR